MTDPGPRLSNLAELSTRAERGGAERYHSRLAEQNKLFVRDRLSLLLDSMDGFAENGLLVNCLLYTSPSPRDRS